jgi:ERCC4-type nuclease
VRVLDLHGAVLKGRLWPQLAWIHRLAVRCQEVEPAAGRPVYAQRRRPRAGAGAEAAEALLASVPGISTSSARALLERFGTVAAVVAAGPAEWLTVPGIGPERARALEETLCVRWHPLATAGDRSDALESTLN